MNPCLAESITILFSNGLVSSRNTNKVQVIKTSACPHEPACLKQCVSVWTEVSLLVAWLNGMALPGDSGGRPGQGFKQSVINKSHGYVASALICAPCLMEMADLPSP